MEKFAKTNSPFLVANITNRCNLKCPHCCYESGKKSKEADLAVWKDSFEFFWHVGSRTVSFTGGEPFLSEKTVPLSEFAKSMGYAIKFNTNGTLIDEKKADWLKFIEPFEVRISLDGAAPEQNDSIRGKGSFNLAMRACELLSQRGITVSINTTVGAHNLAIIPEIINTAENAGASHVHFYAWQGVGRGKNEKHEILNSHDTETIGRLAKEAIIGRKVLGMPTRDEVPCGEAWLLFMIWPNGSVLPHVSADRFDHKDEVLTNLSSSDFREKVTEYLSSLESEFYPCNECVLQRSTRCFLTNAFCAADVPFSR